ncbi:MAG: hypothetical protein Q8P44_03005, partial [Dehalococcoidia bacterium]|nr:hypothetical protein [Dehalococcoidia bacterium]
MNFILHETWTPDKRMLQERLRGRFGSREKEGTKAVIFNADTGAERDVIMEELKEVIKKVHPSAEVFYTRACAFLHGHVLGDGTDWD